MLNLAALVVSTSTSSLAAALVKDVDKPGRSPYFSVIQGARDCNPASICHFAFDPVQGLVQLGERHLPEH
jgi:hypothetical protein